MKVLKEKMQDVQKNNKGITLIALVVTIVVLLILAGVAISMLSGENGILKQAAEAKESTEDASLQEEIRLVYLSALSTGKGQVDLPTLNSELAKLGFSGVNISKLPATITKDSKNYYKIGKDGDVKSLGNIELVSKTDSFVGYYADVDGDGTTDGVIYADLAKGTSGTRKWAMEY